MSDKSLYYSWEETDEEFIKRSNRKEKRNIFRILDIIQVIVGVPALILFLFFLLKDIFGG